MSIASPYYQLEHQSGAGKEPIKPFWSLDHQDDEKVLDWTSNTLQSLWDWNQARASLASRNRAFYAGLQAPTMFRVARNTDSLERYDSDFKRGKIYGNQVVDLVEQWVSKLTRFAPAFTVLPANDERNDRVAAKLSKAFIDYAFYVNDIDELLERLVRYSRIDGECYLLVDWDDTKGDLHPSEAARDALGLQKVPLVDSTGAPVLGSDGEQLFIEKRQRVGDIKYSLIDAERLFLHPALEYKDCDWGVIVTPISLEEAKAKYPDAGIESGNTCLPGMNSSNEECWQVEIYHRGTEFLDGGYYCKIINDKVVDRRSLKDKVGHTELPWVRLTCLDVPGELHGLSFMQNLLMLQVVYNNLLSIAYNNLALAAHIYWMVPGAANVDVGKIRNSPSVIRYNGPVAPKVEQFKVVGSEVFEMLQFLENLIRKVSGIQGISQGQPPTGIESQIALVFMEEQENQRANSDIKKYNAALKKLARFTLATAGAFYSEDDGRTLRIVGKNNQFSVKALEVAKLGGPFDIRVQRTTALSESKSGRLSQLLAIEARKPGVIPNKQFLDMLELSSDTKFYDAATVAVQKAEHENEQMFEGFEVTEPQRWEEHLTHWYTHYKYMQSAAFADNVPDEIKELFSAHLLVHEFWIQEKMANPRFAQMVLTSPEMENFPALMPIPAPTPAPPPPPGPGGPQGGGEPPPGPGVPGENPEALEQGDPNAEAGPAPSESPEAPPVA